MSTRRKSISKNRLLATVAVSTLAAIAFFSLFYVIGAVIGLAAFAALGVALVIGLAYLGIKLGRQPAQARIRSTPPPS